MYSWGYSRYGLSVHGNKSHKNKPEKFDPNCFNNEPIKFISVSASFSFALTKNNNLYAWGNNYGGQLGLGNTKDTYEPTLVDSKTYNNEKILKIEGGDDHTLLLTEESDGSTHIHSCGEDKYGQLGLNSRGNENTFERIDSNYFMNKKIKDIKAGDYFSLALVQEKDSNETNIYSWGDNDQGQLGLGDNENRNTPCQIDLSSFNGQKIISIGNGSCHSFAITKEHGTNNTKVYAWGDNSRGQLGLGYCNDISKPAPINMEYFKEQSSRTKRSQEIVFVSGDCGSYGHSFAITKTGKLFIWGFNNNGQLGLNHCKDMNLPQECCHELFGVSNTNEKMYKNQYFEDVLFEFD